MSGIQEMPSEDVLSKQDGITDKLAANADVKLGALTSWKDTDGTEVEITLPLPPGVGKADLRVKCSSTKLLDESGGAIFLDEGADGEQMEVLGTLVGGLWRVCSRHVVVRSERLIVEEVLVAIQEVAEWSSRPGVPAL